MPEDWDSWRAFANEMIADSGFAATLRKKGAVAGGVRGLRTQVSSTRATHQVTIVENSQASEIVPDTLREGGPNLSDVRSFFLGTTVADNADVVPEEGDTLVVQGRDLNIIRVDTTAPGGVDVVYLVHTER